MAGGGSANLWLVKIHPLYSGAIPDDTKDVRFARSFIYATISSDTANTWNCLGEQYANTFELNEYTTLDAQTYYDNETSAFNLIGSNSQIIGFYRNFTRNGTLNVLLEYADKETLKELLEESGSSSTNNDRIVVNYRGLNVEDLIRSEIENRKGRSVISRKSGYEVT